MSNLIKKDKGFTLIEIVLVLAIAGLLLVIVFLAVSGAQKSRRDTQRKNDVSRVAAALENYASNNNGVYPTVATVSTDMVSYLPAANYLDPLTGTVYGTSVGAVAVGRTPGGTVTFGGAAIVPTGTAAATLRYALPSPRTYKVCISLEQGSENCRTNQ